MNMFIHSQNLIAKDKVFRKHELLTIFNDNGVIEVFAAADVCVTFAQTFSVPVRDALLGDYSRL